MITRQSIETVLESADIVEIISRFVDLKKAGTIHKGLCPFHDEKTPSFSVSPAKQIFKCFGCGKGGNVIQFLLAQNKTYPEAIKFLADAYNITLEYSDEKKTIEQEDAEQKARKALTTAAIEFAKQINEADACIKYLRSRGIADDICTEWSIGYSPPEWQFLTNRLREDNLFDIATQLGLINTSENGNAYDALRARITIPIYDHLGTLKGFAGRDISKLIDPEGEKEPPKYINPKESFYYNKSKILFALDRARKSISDNGYAIIVEGYFDVISMHTAGYLNTVAACGTALTADQAKLLKRYCTKIVLMYDGDKPGQEALLRNMDVLLQEGFKVLVKRLDDNIDPDEWARSETIEHPLNGKFLGDCFDALLWFSQDNYQAAGDPHEKDLSLSQTAQKIAFIPSETIRDEYADLIAKQIKVKKKSLTEKIKEFFAKFTEQKDKQERRRQQQEGVPDEYTLPPEMLHKGLKWHEIKDDVYNYSLFIYDNRIWSRRGEDNYHFKEISNFSIKIIQHMDDEKIPKKLAQIVNTYGRKRTFDAPSEKFTNLYAFKSLVESFGNYNIDKAIDQDYFRLKEKLFNEMGDGRMINILGWQSEGFFAFNNAIVYPDGKLNYLDNYGCFEHDKSNYYIPSANQLYLNNPARYTLQKKIILRNAKISFEEFTRLMLDVHREHAMTAMLFTIASMFSDVIFERTTFFPILFLYGEPSSGKDNLIECCQAFFGKPQEAIEITGKANTDKGKIRSFAQLRNTILHMSEYRNGSEDIDQSLAAIWERKGYVKGNIESDVSTDKVPILQSLIFTSNQYPTLDALITRIITEEMNKDKFSIEESRQYDKLKELIQDDGISSFTTHILKLRSRFEKEFRQAFNDAAADLKSNMSTLTIADRMIKNVAVLAATFKLSEHHIPFNFSYESWHVHMLASMGKQSDKRDIGSLVSRWWDCILESMRVKMTRGRETSMVNREAMLVYQEDYCVKGEHLILNFKSAYAAYMKVHATLFRSAGQYKNVMMDKLKRDVSWVEEKNSVQYGRHKTSGYVFMLAKTGIQDEVISIVKVIDDDYAYSTRADNEESTLPTHPKVVQTTLQNFYEKEVVEKSPF